MGLVNNLLRKKSPEELEWEEERRARKINQSYDDINRDLNQFSMYQSLDDDDKTGVVSTTLDNSSIIREIENVLRGRILTVGVDGKTHAVQVCEPVMNEAGIQSVLQEIIPRVGKNAILASLSEDDARKMADTCHTNLALLFAANSRRFNIDKSRRTNVLWQISNMIFLSLSRSIHGAERKEVYGHTKAVEHRSTTEQGTPDRRIKVLGW